MQLKISEALANLPTIDYRELNELQGNLKDLSQDNFMRLKTNLFGAEGIPANGFVYPFFVWFEGKKRKPYVVDGHQRLRVIQTVGATTYQLPYVEVKAANKKEAKQMLLLASSEYGKMTREGWDSFAFDLDADWVRGLTTFEAFTLPPLELEEFATEVGNALYGEGDEIGDVYEEDGMSENSENLYTSKVAAPTYEPKNEKPELSSVFKSERATELIKEASEAKGISEKERDFLIKAASRRLVFNYELIADYYAHASKPMQELMEKSALVIIDFDSAIELGYAKLSEQINKIKEREYKEGNTDE